MLLNPCKIIRSRRKTITLEVKDDASILIRAPRFVPTNFLQDLIAKKQRWIKKRQAQVLKKQEFRQQIDVESCKTKAAQLIPQRVTFYSDITGIDCKKVKITSAKKRWGSCSSRGNLNFSWRLVLAPLPVIDYVVVHELAHIIHRNHSKRFWALVKKLYPNYKTCRKWLRSEGHLL